MKVRADVATEHMLACAWRIDTHSHVELNVGSMAHLLYGSREMKTQSLGNCCFFSWAAFVTHKPHNVLWLKNAIAKALLMVVGGKRRRWWGVWASAGRFTHTNLFMLIHASAALSLNVTILQCAAETQFRCIIRKTKYIMIKN